jgi:hypothetical protein
MPIGLPPLLLLPQPVTTTAAPPVVAIAMRSARAPRAGLLMCRSRSRPGWAC